MTSSSKIPVAERPKAFGPYHQGPRADPDPEDRSPFDAATIPRIFPATMNPDHDPSAPPPATPRSRREFVSLASGCLLCGLGARRASAATFKPIDIGELKDWPKDEISEKFIQYDIFVIRHKGRLYASTAICPHKSNFLLLDPQNPNRIICSGHDSTFTPEGIPTGGPARRGLVRYGISVNAEGRVTVDTLREFPQAQWDDKGSYVPVK